MTVGFSGDIHPYIEDLPIFEDKVDEIAESIDEVGLLHPITLDNEGRVIGGRHRLQACEVAGIDPTFEVWEGDALSFMLHDNDARKHQTTGQLAAEKALTLDSAGWRSNQRWKRGTVDITEFGNSGSDWSNRMREAGVILDYLGRDALAEVAQGDVAINAKFEEARREKERIENAERLKVEQARQETEREEYATEYFEGHAAAAEWLASKPDGVFETKRAAFAAYQEHDREARAAEEARRQEEQRRQREHRDALQRDANRLKGFLVGYGQAWDMRDHPHRNDVLDLLDPAEKKRFITIEGEITWPDTKN